MTNLVNHKGTFRVSYEFDSGNYLKFTLDDIETHQRKNNLELYPDCSGSIISVVGKTTVELIELFECRQKVP